MSTMAIRDWFKPKAPAKGPAPEPAVVEAPDLPPLPVATAPTEAVQRLQAALTLREQDPIRCGELLIQVERDTGLTLYQLSRLDKTMSEPGLQNLVYLAKLPHEIHIMVRQGALAASKAQLIGRYLATGTVEQQIKAAQSVIKHCTTLNQVQTLGRIWLKSGEFQFKD